MTPLKPQRPPVPYNVVCRSTATPAGIPQPQPHLRPPLPPCPSPHPPNPQPTAPRPQAAGGRHWSASSPLPACCGQCPCGASRPTPRWRWAARGWPWWTSCTFGRPTRTRRWQGRCWRETSAPYPRGWVSGWWGGQLAHVVWSSAGGSARCRTLGHRMPVGPALARLMRRSLCSIVRRL